MILRLREFYPWLDLNRYTIKSIELPLNKNTYPFFPRKKYRAVFGESMKSKVSFPVKKFFVSTNAPAVPYTPAIEGCPSASVIGISTSFMMSFNFTPSIMICIKCDFQVLFCLRIGCKVYVNHKWFNSPTLGSEKMKVQL